MSEFKYVPVEILDRFPELNMSNYGPDDVDELNAWGIELVLAEAPTQPSPAEFDKEPILTQKGDIRFMDGVWWLCTDPDINRWISAGEPSTMEAVRNAALDEAAKIPRQYAEQLDAGIFGARFPEATTHIFNASTNMADKIRALKSQPAQPSDSQADVSDVEKDAAKYRWLLSQMQVGSVSTMLPLYRTAHWIGYEPCADVKDVDSAIETAMRAQEG